MRSFLRLLATCLICFTGGAFAQRLSFGLLGGASLTQDFQNNISDFGGTAPVTNYSTPKRYIVGGLLEVRLPFNLSVEAEGLFHELEYTSATIENGTPFSVSPAPVVTWEFPILAKYRFALPILRPFIEAGPSFRTSGNLNSTSPSNHGFAAGLGVEAKLWKLKLAPQLRYIRWARDSRMAGFGAPFTKPDQVEFLVSLSF